MYDVRIVVAIRYAGGVSSNDRYVSRQFWLPLPPFNGLVIHDGELMHTVDNISVSAGKEKIICWTKDDTTRKNQMTMRQDPVVSIDHLVEEYLEDGWVEIQFKETL